MLLAFVASAALYALGFATLEHLRHRKGPWVVEFQTDPQGRPALLVRQPRVGIEAFTLHFSGTNLPIPNLRQRWVFDTPTRRSGLPFGRVVFLDTTFLPGTVTLELFGHQVELLPRVLILDKQEEPWQRRHDLVLPAR